MQQAVAAGLDLNLDVTLNLPNIERRVRHLGGSFRLVTAPDGGALLEVEVPVQEPSATIAPS